jgi:hypothetical protein
MGISGGPDMIQDGLVLALNAADKNSYPGSGTTWNDLSGNNNNGTLTNSPTYDNLGYFTFASNKHVTTSLSNITLSSATFISWVYSTQTQALYTGIIYSRSGTEPAGISLYTNNSIGYTWTNTPATYNWNSGLLVPNNAWSMIAISINSTTATAYLCQSSGITTATNVTSHTSLSGLNFYIACDPFSITSRVFIGNIASAQVYNRVLSATEILQNYNAQKSRFNL